jgi:hypothetical protein
MISTYTQEESFLNRSGLYDSRVNTKSFGAKFILTVTEVRAIKPTNNRERALYIFVFLK